MKIYLVDNFDSFTYNLVHLFREQGLDEVKVVRNDVADPAVARNYDAVVISPGPGVPARAGRLMPFLESLGGRMPVFGVCLGMQAIGELYGGRLRNLSRVYHGLQTEVELQEHPLFTGLSGRIPVGRYHSWVVDREGLPNDLQILASDEQGEVMALSHRQFPVLGVQFHPESVLTPLGGQIAANFLQLALRHKQQQP